MGEKVGRERKRMEVTDEGLCVCGDANVCWSAHGRGGLRTASNEAVVEL